MSQYLAIVPTAYEIYAIGSTEAEAKRKALGAALEWLQMGGVEYEHGKQYKTQAQVEEWLGCNVFQFSDLGVAQEG